MDFGSLDISNFAFAELRPFTFIVLLGAPNPIFAIEGEYRKVKL